MKILSIALLVFLILYGLIYLYLLIVSRKPFKYLFLNAFVGWWCFAVIEMLSFFSGIHIPLNPFTAAVSGIFGVPGTFFLIVLKYCIFV